MKKERVINLLKEYHPTDMDEVHWKDETIQFIEEHEKDFYLRDSKKGHVVATPWLLNDAEDKVLLFFDEKQDKWFPLDGYCTYEGKDIFDSLKLSTEIETHIKNLEINEKVFDVEIHQRPERSFEAEHLHYEIRFLVKMTDPAEKPKKRVDVKHLPWVPKRKDGKKLKWLSKSATLPQNQSRSIKRLFKKWQNSYTLI